MAWSTVQITHKLNSARMSHACCSHGMGVVIATPMCIFVMGNMCTVHPLYMRVAMYLPYIFISVYLNLLYGTAQL